MAVEALVIGPTAIKVLRKPTADGARWTRSELGGDLSRSLSGRQGGTILWEKYELVIQPALLTTAQLNSLISQCSNGKKPICSGSLIGSARAFSVVISEPRAVRRGSSIRWRTTLILREV